MIAEKRNQALKALAIGLPTCLVCGWLFNQRHADGLTALVEALIALGMSIYVMFGCGWMAESKGRAWSWAWLSLLNPIIAWIVVLCLPDRTR